MNKTQRNHKRAISLYVIEISFDFYIRSVCFRNINCWGENCKKKQKFGKNYIKA